MRAQGKKRQLRGGDAPAAGLAMWRREGAALHGGG